MKMIKLCQYDTNRVETITNIIDQVIINSIDGRKIVITTTEKDSDKNKQLGIEIGSLLNEIKESEKHIMGIRIPKFSIMGINGTTVLDDNGILQKPNEYKSKSEVIDRIDYIIENNKEYNTDNIISRGLINVGGLRHHSELQVLFNILGIPEYYNFGDGLRFTCHIINDYVELKSDIKEREKQSEIDKLEELCKPISDYLRENYCPHDSIVITDDKIRLIRDQIGIPVDRDSEEENIYDIVNTAIEEYLKSLNKSLELIKEFNSKTK